MTNNLLKNSLILLSIFLFSQNIKAQISTTWKSLFNGKDLKNWDTYLRPSEAAADQTPIGHNKDPHKVFTVVDGTMRISGQDWGSIITKEEYENYHIRFQIKWGEKKWAPREAAIMDGGLLYHSTEPYDFMAKCWMRSSELQIQEGDIGDYHNVGAEISEFQLSNYSERGEEMQQYDPSAPFKRYDKRISHSGDFESPKGEWTTAELITRGADAVFIVNGFVVNRAYNGFRTDLQRQVTKGRIQFQSEGAEHFLRKIELRPLAFSQSSKPLFKSDKNEVTITGDKSETVTITNNGETVEIIAVELLGKQITDFAVKLPTFPLVVKKGDKIQFSTSMKNKGVKNQVKLRLETIYGPVPDFEITFKAE